MRNHLFTRGMRAAYYKPDPLSKILADVRITDELRLTPRITTSTEVTVPDVSFWQDDDTTARKIDFMQMKAAGAPGVIIRAGQGSWADEDFADYWVAAKAAGLARGAYWFYDPRVAPKSQADLFASLLAADKPELGMTLDAEYPTSWGGAYAGWQHLYDCLERLKTHAPTMGVSKEIYTGYYWWYDNVWTKTTVAQREYFKQYPLHLAWYITDPTYVKIPLPWTQNELRWWQYTDKGNGPLYGVESFNVDLNYFVPGGLNEFQDTYNMSTTPPPTPVEVRTLIFEGNAERIAGILYTPRQVNYKLYICSTDQAEFIVTEPNAGGLLMPMRTSDFALAYNSDIAINGDEGYVDIVTELFYLKRRAMSKGRKYGAQNDGATISASKQAPYQFSVSWNGYAAFCWNAISGSKLLLENGVYGNFVDNLPPDPRTIFGWNTDSSKVFWLVIDGRGAGGSQGATLKEGADLIRRYGATFAVNLDGGGSSTAVEKVNGVQTIMNQPSDATGERYVANHWGIKFKTGENPMGDHYEYTATGNRAIRQNWGATSPRIVSNSDLLVNTKALGGALAEDRHVLTASEAIAYQGLVNDVWVRVYDNNTKPVDGWTALVHKGIPQLTEKFVPGTSIPTVSPVVFASMDFDLAARTMTTTRRRQDGTSDIDRDPIA